MFSGLDYETAEPNTLEKGCISVENADLPLGCTEKFNSETQYFEQTCVCDTPYCNSESNMAANFTCFSGDYNLNQVEDGSITVEDTISCYIGRNPCFLMKYNGNYHTILVQLYLMPCTLFNNEFIALELAYF